jgi:hypothetical protein
MEEEEEEEEEEGGAPIYTWALLCRKRPPNSCLLTPRGLDLVFADSLSGLVAFKLRRRQRRHFSKVNYLPSNHFHMLQLQF